jgi:hypothetical protein
VSDLEPGAGPAPRARLRALLAAAPQAGPLVAPGAYDALSARLVEQAGFDAVYMTGFGTSAALLGGPDIGLLSAGEMADNVRRLAAAVEVRRRASRTGVVLTPSSKANSSCVMFRSTTQLEPARQRESPWV